MTRSIALLCRKDPRKAAWLALPLALGAAVLQPVLPAFATDAPAPAAFARPQFADVIEAAQPAVVKIEVVKKIGGIARLAGRAPGAEQGAPFEEFFGRFGPGPFAFGHPQAPEGRAEGLGSGFIIDSSGYVVTNNHVIEGAEDIKLTLADGKSMPAHLIGSDPVTDLALLKVDSDTSLPAIAFGDSDSARVGDWVVAIGSPFGLGGSVTAGIISARGRDIRSGPYDDYLQIDAPINSGNSGGPIIGADGKVIGVNTAIYSPNGGNIGIGFAIPAREAARVVAELREHGTITRGWLGVQIQPVTAELASALEVKDVAGALVAAVIEKGPAARAGIAVGDVITAFGDTPIKDPRDLSRAVAHAEPGAKIEIQLIRQGQPRTVTTIVDRNAETPLASSAPESGDAAADAALGLALGPLSPEARAQLNLDDDVTGALVVGVKSGGAADTSGVQPGDIIVRVNRAEVADAAAAAAALGAASQGEQAVVVLIRRGDQQFFTTMKNA